MDYQVKVRVRNGRIVRKMREQGFDSLADLVRYMDGSRAGGPTYSHLCTLIQMKVSPLNRSGEWRPIVIRLSEALGCVPEELFNEQQMTSPLKCSSGEAFMDWPQVCSLMGDGGIDAIEARRTVDQLLSRLTDRHAKVIRLRMDGATYSEIGEALGVRLERACQIEKRAQVELAKAARPKLLPIAA